MPLFLIERQFADQIELTAGDVAAITRINSDSGVQWLHSFLSADKRKSYCLYEAPSEEAIRQAAQVAGLPADVVVAVSEVDPKKFGSPLPN